MIRTYLINDSGYNSSFSAAMASGFAKSPQRSALTTPPGFLLALLVSLEKPKFRFRRIYEISSRRIVLVALFSVIVSLLVSGIALAADFAWPVEGKVLRSFEKDVHRGIDIEVTQGTRVRAAVSGTVTYVGYSEGSSSDLYHTVSIEYGSEGYHTSYLQIKPLVAKGESVVQGQEIGEVVKSTDDDTAADHLYFGVWQKTASSKIYQNPLDFLPPLSLSEQSQGSSEQVVATSPSPSGEGAQATVSPQVAPVTTEGSENVPAPRNAQNENAPSTSAASPVEQVPQASIANSPNQSLTALPPTAEASSVAPAVPPVTQNSRMDTESKPVELQGAARVSSKVAEPTPINSHKEVSCTAVETTAAVATAVTEAVCSGTKPISALKDKQIEALNLAVSGGLKPVASINQLKQKALCAEMVAEDEVLSLDATLAVIPRLLFYVLILISSLGLARTSRWHLGPPAYL